MVRFTDKELSMVMVRVSITESDIENIIKSSFEGGSNSWLGVDTTTKEWENRPEDESVAGWATTLLLEGKTIKLQDITDEGLLEDDKTWELTLPKLIEGIKSDSDNISQFPDKGTWSIADADCIIQYAMFGEIIYE